MFEIQLLNYYAGIPVEMGYMILSDSNHYNLLAFDLIACK